MNKELQDWIDQARARGISEQEIIEKLTNAGWDKLEVKRQLQSIAHDNSKIKASRHSAVIIVFIVILLVGFAAVAYLLFFKQQNSTNSQDVTYSSVASEKKDSGNVNLVNLNADNVNTGNTNVTNVSAVNVNVANVNISKTNQSNVNTVPPPPSTSPTKESMKTLITAYADERGIGTPAPFTTLAVGACTSSNIFVNERIFDSVFPSGMSDSIYYINFVDCPADVDINTYADTAYGMLEPDDVTLTKLQSTIETATESEVQVQTKEVSYSPVFTGIKEGVQTTAHYTIRLFDCDGFIVEGSLFYYEDLLIPGKIYYDDLFQQLITSCSAN